MDKDRARIFMIEVLQNTLAGKIKLESNVSPQRIADALIEKINFERLSMESKNEELISLIIEGINKYQVEMKKELDNLNDDQKLLENYIRGKLTAYVEVLDIINHL